MKKIMRGLMVLVLLVGCMSGCGSSKEDAAEIIDEAIKELKKVESYNTNLKIILDMNMKSGGSTINGLFDADLSLDHLVKEEVAHVKGTMQIETMGVSESDKMEIYAFKEDGKYVQYSKSGEADSWSFEESKQMLAFNSVELLEAMKTADKLETDGSGEVDGKKTNVVEATVDGETIQKALDMMEDDEETASMMSMFSGSDFSEIDFVVKMQFYKDSGLPASLEMDFTSFSEEIMKSMNDSELYGDMDFEMSFEEFKITLTHSNYDKVKAIDVPEKFDVSSDDYSGNYEDGVDNPKGDWNRFEFTYQGKNYKLPLSYSDLEAMGFTVSEDTLKNTTVAAKGSEYWVEATNDKKQTIILSFYNESDSKKKLAECKISSIQIDDDISADIDLELPGGIRLGKTEAELNKAYPEFSNKYTSDVHRSYSYYGDLDKDERLNIEINEEGKISLIIYERQ
ncbi:putative RNase H-like HicB family nuclease [Breznakia sp. PF5-3]|uniref:hypothetical protein n=1 Tax=unclassified Breznakia TaxID=2623764 RepID=UPI00240644EE|nr:MULTISPECIES: hypothetical protein [unclassified Breznakia]MDL2276515.1 hypothetical protein [Breznakia sp. OttesenSCG-928-G09]MDF9825804.1 putative RNase H-like HicB family nuclease [Breznakia sp. PM6-1]MDF9836609.1 putative RNase H-like HicB family nuclease [Breznakia sp. PF5-3]MDF9838841.1 putative RNase H-like HicB family nuclease [Breznakia sp. PFB2-8]MDF9860867.1 putative RNase H-like HicB family nuclease [Breznakia sp. PH5-24]